MSDPKHKFTSVSNPSQGKKKPPQLHTVILFLQYEAWYLQVKEHSSFWQLSVDVLPNLKSVHHLKLGAVLGCRYCCALQILKAAGSATLSFSSFAQEALQDFGLCCKCSWRKYISKFFWMTHNRDLYLFFLLEWFSFNFTATNPFRSLLFLNTP